MTLILKNIFYNICAQFTSAIIFAFIIPSYLSFLGTENFGLFSVYLTVQVTLLIFELGFSPAFLRIAAQIRDDQDSQKNIQLLFFTIEKCYFMLVIIIISLSIYHTPFLAKKFINSETIDPDTLAKSIQLIFGISAITLIIGFYRSALNAYEEQKFTAINIMIFNIIKYIFSFPIMLIKPDIIILFSYIFVFSLSEAVVLRRKIRNDILGKLDNQTLLSFKTDLLKKVLITAFPIGYGALTWILMTQADKWILLNKLTLSDFGLYSLVVMAAGIILRFGAPVNTAIAPILSRLAKRSDICEIKKLYLTVQSLQLAFSLSVALILISFSDYLVFIITNDQEAANLASNIIIFVALGNVFLPVSSHLLQVQIAIGKMKIHMISSTLTLFVHIPLLFYGVHNYGIYGAAISWFTIRVLAYLIWSYVIHDLFLNDFNKIWWKKVVLPNVITFLLIYLIINFGLIRYDFESIITSMLWIILIFTTTIICFLIFIDVNRTALKTYVKMRL